MTTLGKVFRTTAFKLSATYLVVFAGCAVFLIAYISYNTTTLLSGQLHQTLIEETRELSAIYRRGGIRRLVTAIDIRSHRPGAFLYLVTDLSGRALTGNIKGLPSEVLNTAGMHDVTYEYLQSDDQKNTHISHAIIRVFILPTGFRLLVGRDIGEQLEFRHIITNAFLWSLGVMIVLAAASWFFVSRRVLKRIDSVSEASRQIMAGDLSKRIAITGTGDEFDRLAQSLNIMLERIEYLMTGLKTVSDNIAHDLKTPLTRLRNRVDEALHSPSSEQGYYNALASTIEESDRLIRIFDALLMISRVEAGAPDGAMQKIDIGAIVADLSELYQPVAEDAGVAFETLIDDNLTLHANRELLGQALANLIDNALKYAGTSKSNIPPYIRISAQKTETGVQLSVIDNGPGIDKQDREHAVERFVRFEKSRSQPGSGLGLSLVKAVARMHDGTFELQDAKLIDNTLKENDTGLAAILTLPRHNEAT